MSSEPAPILDIRVRWRAGQVALGLAGVMALVALTRPLASGFSPRVKLVVTVALGLGVAGSALLASLRGRGRSEMLALYAFLVLSVDALGQLVGPLGWPIWPPVVLLIAALAVAETLPVALGAAALASVLATADVARSSFEHWQQAVAATLGYGALVLALNRALLGEKRRLSTTLAELARIQHGIDQLDEDEPPSVAALTLRQVSQEGRRTRQNERAEALSEALGRLAHVARTAIDAHSVLYFDVDREREVAPLRAAAGPDALMRDAVLPLSADPVAFVLDRRQAFYATDFRRVLWALPYYRGEVKIGTLLAVPVRMDDVVTGILVADRIEIQSLTGREPEVLEAFAQMIADTVRQARASGRDVEQGQEFKAVYDVSGTLATLTEPMPLRRKLLRSAREVVKLDGAAVVTTDDPASRYVVDEADGWAREFVGRQVAISEKTWTAWVLRSEEPYLLDSVSGHEKRMPILVLDEGAGRAESLLALPLKARNRTLGALILTAPRGTFDTRVQRVLGILTNQAAAVLSTIQLLDQIRELAVRDGLTGLYNRRAFGELLAQSLAREERQGGHFALLMLDIDNFKKLNDTYGHPAGDAALKATADTLAQHLRKGDQAARYGGEEFAVILPGADEAGAIQLAERVRTAMEKTQTNFEGGARLCVTASFGAAVWPADGKDPQSLLAAADRALYAAKQAGRNRVVAASAVPAPPAAPTSS